VAPHEVINDQLEVLAGIGVTILDAVVHAEIIGAVTDSTFVESSCCRGFVRLAVLIVYVHVILFSWRRIESSWRRMQKRKMICP
jgi:hypothetical protein